jgi:hypothetical protein
LVVSHSTCREKEEEMKIALKKPRRGTEPNVSAQGEAQIPGGLSGLQQRGYTM